MAPGRTKRRVDPTAAGFASGGKAEPSAPDRRPETVAGSPGARIVEVAREMFCRDGIHATGIDKILAAAGASKMTLYSRFGSKDALLREVLRLEGEAWRSDFFAALEGISSDPRERLSHTVRALDRWFRGGRFYGCAFMNAVAEHTKGEAWLRDLAGRHHREIIDYLTNLASAGRYAEPEILARQIMLVVDGAIAALMVSGDLAVLSIADRNLVAVLAQASTAA